jgi:hypothetical protein
MAAPKEIRGMRGAFVSPRKLTESAKSSATTNSMPSFGRVGVDALGGANVYGWHGLNQSLNLGGPPAASPSRPGGRPGRLGAVATEWRVEVELDEEGHGFGLGERLRALRLDDEARGRLGKRVIVTRDGSRVFLYADSQEATREAERVVRELVADHELTADVRLARWDPIEEAWRDASEPLPASEEEREAALARKEAAEAEEAREEGRYDWEVHADLDSHDDALRVAERLEAEGHPVARRWSYLIVGALTEERAGELAEWLRAEAPAGTEVEIVPLLDEPAHPVFVWLGAHGLAPPG